MLLSPRYHCIYYSSVEWANCLFFLYVQVLVVEFWKDIEFATLWMGMPDLLSKPLNSVILFDMKQRCVYQMLLT